MQTPIRGIQIRKVYACCPGWPSGVVIREPQSERNIYTIPPSLQLPANNWRSAGPGHSSARIYGPSFRENKKKTLVFNDWKRAFLTCFRENWVYKFRHWCLLSLTGFSATKRVTIQSWLHVVLGQTSRYVGQWSQLYMQPMYNVYRWLNDIDQKKSPFISFIGHQ